MTKQLIKLCLASILSLSLNTGLKAQETTPSIHATQEIVIAEDTLSEIESFIHEAQTNHPNVRISFSAQNGEIVFQKLPEKLLQNVESILKSLNTQNWLDSLRSFKISNAIFDQNTSLLPSVLSKMTNLQSLILNNTNLNSMEENGFKVFANALSAKTNLQVLDFENNNLGKKFATLVSAIANMPNLQTLNLGSNHIDLMKADDFEALANALATKTKLQTLDLSKNYFGKKFAILIPAIANMANLQTLNLEYNYLESICLDGLEALANALASKTKLQILDLSKNYFGKKFAILIPAIANMPDLQELNLKFNHIGLMEADGLEALANALSSLTKLQFLDLSKNRFKEKFSILHSATANMPNLKLIYLEEDYLGSEKARKRGTLRRQLLSTHPRMFDRFKSLMTIYRR